MKQRILSTWMALALCLTLLPTAALAAETPTCTCEAACTAEAMNTDCPVCGMEGAAVENCGKYEAQEESPAEQTAGEQVQALINALPDADTLTAETRADVEAQLTAIDDAKLPLTDEELETLDITKYNAAIAKLNELDDMAGADVPAALEAPTAGENSNGTYEVTSNTTLDGDVTFDSDTTLNVSQSATLTINGTLTCNGDLTISGGTVTATGGTATGGNSYGIYVDGDLTISGSNTEVTANSGTAKYSYGIYVDGDLTISGSNTEVTANSGTAKYSYGIYVDGDLTISDTAEVTATGGAATSGNSYGIYVDGDLTVSGSNTEVTATGGDAGAYSYGIRVTKNGSITISDTGEVTANGGNAGSGSYSCGVCKENGSITIENSATLTATGGTATGGSSYGIYVQSLLTTTTITVTGGTVTANGGTVTANGGAATRKSCGIYVQSLYTTTITVTGGTVTATGSDGSNGSAVEIQSNSTLYADGGTVNGAVTNAGTITHSEGVTTATEFTGTVDNSGTIQWGVFYGGITNSGEGTISGKTVTFMKDSTTDYVKVIVPSGSTVTQPAVPGKDNHIFAGWYTDEDCADNTKFDFTTAITGDITLYAKWTVPDYDWYTNAAADATEYTISNAAQLLAFANLVNGTKEPGVVQDNVTFDGKTVKLAEDIDLGGITNWTPIGSYSNPFKGTFNGNDKTISNLTVNSNAESDYVGLFGYTDGATIQKLAVSGSVTANGKSSTVGGIVGVLTGGKIENCSFSGSVAALRSYSVGGGIVGRASGTISKCCNTAAVSGKGQSLGGIAGATDHDILYCYNGGTVTHDFECDSGVGGIAGFVIGYGSSPTVRSCYSTGTVSATGDSAEVGGSVGHIAVTDGYAVTINGVYYLTGTASTGIGQTSGTVTGESVAKSADEFASGEVAWLLQSAAAEADGQVWGQLLSGTDKDTYPVFANSNGSNKVCKVTFKVDGADDVIKYVNSGNTVSMDDPTAPTGYTFAGWYDAETDGDRVELPTAITADTTLYARFAAISSGGSSRPTYPISVSDPDNGTVSASAKSAKSGRTVTITVAPDAGYSLETLTVLDKNGKEVVLTDKGDGTYTFTMPSGKVTVEATFQEDNTMLNHFVDVFPGDYYYDAVLWAAKNGITGGIDETHFGPDLSCTRAQLVTFLWRAAGCPVVNYAMDFSDVGDSYYTEAVRWAASLGIVDGYGNGLFGTNDTITREQFVTILYRYAVAMGYDVSAGEDTNILSYHDALDVSAYAVEAFQWAIGAGIVQGDGANLMPQDDCTRAQIVTMLHRLLGA